MNKKILIIDDEIDILEPISLVVESFDYIVKTITDGNKIAEEIKSFKPDLILLDILISGSDGRIICKKLKENSKTKQIPILIMSAHPTAKEDAKNSLADGFIAKPFDSTELISQIKAAIGS